MLNHQPGAALVVDAKGWVAASSEPRVDQHDRDVLGHIAAQKIVVDVRGHQQQAVHAAVHGTQGRRRFISVAMRARQQQVQPARAGCQVDTADQLGEVFAVQIGQHRADGLRAAQREAACRA